MTNSLTDVKNFRNPSGHWEYEGAFSVELTPETDKDIAPPSTEVRGDTVYVPHGRIKQVAGGILLRSRESPFYWGYPRIKIIRDGDGNPLWVNNDYR